MMDRLEVLNGRVVTLTKKEQSYIDIEAETDIAVDETLIDYLKTCWRGDMLTMLNFNTVYEQTTITNVVMSTNKPDKWLVVEPFSYK